MSRLDLPNEKAPNFNARLRETMMTYLGKTGDPLDRGVTLRDLVDSGLVKVDNIKAASGGGSVPLSPGDSIANAVVSVGVEPDLTEPPTPEGFAVSASINSVFVEHDKPIFTQGHGYFRTRVYGVKVVDGALPVFSDATEISQFSGTIGSFSSDPETTWRLWIKWETADGVLSAFPAGGTNGLEVTTGTNVELVLSGLAGKITGEMLYTDLSTRIDKIEVNELAIANEATARANGIASEATARANADTALSNTITTLSSTVTSNNTTLTSAIQTEATTRADADTALSNTITTLSTSVSDNAAAIQTEATTRATADTALSTSLTTLSSTVTTNNTTLTSAIQTEATTRATQTSDIYAKYSVKLDVAGHVSGFGLISTANNATPFSSFGVRANQFFIAPPAVVQATAPTTGRYKGYTWVDTGVTPNVTRYWNGTAWTTTPQAFPFVVDSTGVYMDSAYIKDATITNAKIADAAITNAKISDLDASKITAGTIDAARIDVASITANIANIDAAKITSGTIDSARIGDASITSAKIASSIQSTNYVLGSAGWKIDKAGTVEFQNATVRGTIKSTDGLFVIDTINKTISISV